jgi:hypothetical protein
MKRFYSCIDCPRYVPQPVQHLTIKSHAEKVGGAIVFYGAEEILTLKNQLFIRSKLERIRHTIEGVVFFTFHQFRYGDALNVRLLRHILDMGLEIHFAREGLKILSVDDLDKQLTFFLTVDYTLRRDSDPRWFKMVKEIGNS